VTYFISGPEALPYLCYRIKSKGMSDYKSYIAEWILRVFLGIILFFQGFDKVFKLGVTSVIDTFETEACHKRKVPKNLLCFSAYFTSYTELITGILLILGLFKYAALTLVGIDLLIVAVAFSIIKPMWDMKFVFPRLVLLIVLFLMPREWEIISLDYLLQT
jgi:uncharacterized membrane protein YphA (DoxX/SURF4 family)